MEVFGHFEASFKIILVKCFPIRCGIPSIFIGKARLASVSLKRKATRYWKIPLYSFSYKLIVLPVNIAI